MNSNRTIERGDKEVRRIVVSRDRINSIKARVITRG